MQEFAKRGCKLYMVCRNEERGRAAVDKVISTSGNNDIHLKLCDVSSLNDLRRLAGEYSASGEPLHVLVNNAGEAIGYWDGAAACTF